MNSSILSIRTDEKTKKEIADFAASLGLSVSAFATVVLKQAVRKREVVLKLEPQEKVQREIKIAVADYKKGKNVSPVFSSPKEAADYLRTL